LLLDLKGGIMRFTSSSFLLLLASTVALFGAATPAFAQAGYVPPPQQFTQDDNGVDPKSLLLNYSEQDAKIGGETGGLELVRSIPTHKKIGRQEFGKWIFGLNGYVYTSYDASQDPNPGTKIGMTTLHVVFGGRSMSFFREYMSDWEPDHPATSITSTGTTPNLTVTITAENGDVLTFSNSSDACDVGTPGPNDFCGKINSFVKPSGERLTFTYGNYGTPTKKRLVRVISNFGYAAVFEYPSSTTDQPSKTCLVNSASTYTGALTTCPVGVPATTYTATQATKADGGQVNYTTSLNDFAVRYGSNTLNSLYYRRPTGPGDATVRKLANSSGTTGDLWTYDGTFVDPCMSTGSCSFPSQNKQTIVTAPDSSTVKTEYRDYVVSNTHFIEPLPNKITNQLNNFATFDYGLTGGYVRGTLGLKKMTMPEGDNQNYTYDSRLNRLSQTIKTKPSVGGADIGVSAVFPISCSNPATCNKPTSFTDGRGNVSDFTYNATHGGIVTETLPAAPNGVRPQKRYTYAQYYAWVKNIGGSFVQGSHPIWLVASISECRTLASCVGTADETKTTFTYGTTGVANNLLPTSQTITAGDNSLSTTTGWTYDEWGNKLTEDGPLSGTTDTTRWRYDVMRRVIGVIGPDPDGAGALKHRAVRNTYDSIGRLTKVERGTVNSQSDTDWAAFAALESVETDYDQLDRKLAERQKSGGTTYALAQYSYTNTGDLECTAVRMNSATFASPPASACSLGTEGSDGPDRITKLIYDAAGQVLKTQVAVGTTVAADYQTNSYSNNGKLATITDGENNRTTLEYDGHDRLAKTRYPVTALGAVTSSTTDYEQLTYDANSNVTQRRLRDGQLINSSFDNLNRVITKDLPSPETDVAYAYDLQARLLSATQGSLITSMAYDPLGRMASETSSGYATALQYDAAGRLTRLTHNDGFYVSYVYNTTDLTQINENGAATLVSYTMDNLGRRTALTRGNGTSTAYSYDPVSRLSSFTQDLIGSVQDLTVGSFTYNPASQITGYSRSNDSYAWGGHYNVNRSYATNGLNQLTTAGATALGYDGRGNLTTSGSNTYGYTAENRMITAPAGVTISYNPTGRISQLTQGANTTKFEHLGSRLITERNAGGAILRRYVHGPGDDEPIIWYEGAGTNDKRWLHTDERGSVVAVTNSTGSAFAIFCSITSIQSQASR
jgi:YD repeat-containing protein